MTAYTVNLMEIPYSMVMPIIQWCVDNDIQVEKCVRMLEVWSTKEDIQPEEWELSLSEEQALLFCLRWTRAAT